MAAPAELSGSVPEPRHPQTADPEPATALPGAAAPVPAQASTTQSADVGPAAQSREDPAVAALYPDPDAEPADAEPAGHAEEARKVRPLAIAATVVGIIALVGVAVAVLAVVTHGFRPKTIVTYRIPSVFSLRAGNCIDSAPNGLSVTVLSCATPHDAEVFATFSLGGSSWPGEPAAQQQAANGCMSRLGGYLNPAFANAGFGEEFVYPDRAAWQAGVRTVVCEVRPSGGQLTGTVAKSG
jgi:hypothetical protein